MRIAFALFALAFSMGAAQATPLRVGTKAGFAPYIFQNSADEISGFDKDLMDAVCAEIAAQCQRSNVTYTSLIPALLENDFDVIIGGISATRERRQIISFSQPYLITGGALVFVGRPIGTVLHNARIAVQKVTTQKAYLSGNKYTFVGFATGEEAVDAIKTGTTDLVLGTQGYLEPLVFSSGNHLKIVQRILSEADHAAIGLHPAHTDLKTRLDAALTKFLNDGTIETLTQRWFPIGERL